MGLLGMGAGLVPGTLLGFWEPIPHVVLPCPALIWGFWGILVLHQLTMPCFLDTGAVSGGQREGEGRE